MPLSLRNNQGPPPPEPCALTECLSFLAGTWAPNVIWALRGGPRRFGELRHDIPPISAKVLTTRLRELQQRVIITRMERDTSPPSVEYELTELGTELVPALQAIVDVGHRLKQRPQRDGRRGAPPGATEDGAGR